MNFSETSSKSDLTASDVLDIRLLHSKGLNDSELAREFGVHRKTIYNIVEGKTWKHVPEPVNAKGFKGYVVYPDGRVFSNHSENFLKAINRTAGPAVKLKTTKGVRKTVPVSTLLKKAYGKVAV